MNFRIDNRRIKENVIFKGKQNYLYFHFMKIPEELIEYFKNLTLKSVHYSDQLVPEAKANILQWLMAPNYNNKFHFWIGMLLVEQQMNTYLVEIGGSDPQVIFQYETPTKNASCKAFLVTLTV